MDDLAAFVGARLSEDEAWARAASKPYQYADGNPAAPDGGVHWRWGAGENWEPVEPDLAKDVIGDYGQNVQLMTIETWPSQHGKWQMERPYSDHMCEVNSAAAGHIARHDPARVLREVTAKRAIVADHAPSEVAPDACRRCKGGMAFPCRTLRAIAAVWSDHPDYRPEWAPGHG